MIIKTIQMLRKMIAAKHIRKYCLTVLIPVVIFVLTSTTEGKILKSIQNKNKKIIVLDPGHGGHAKGAHGHYGTFEKTVTLTLSRMIAAELEGEYRLILTRTGDYRLDIPARTAVANNNKADLFISIHTGGSFLHSKSCITIYYYKNILARNTSFDHEPSKLPKNNTDIFWDTIHYKHETASRVFAELVHGRILEQINFFESKIKNASLAVLEGADMPAILIEIGCLTNPYDEKKLSDKDILHNFAKGISNGINDFLKSR